MIGYHQTPDTCGVSAKCLMLAGSKPCLMDANIPTTLLLQQCVNTASYRVSGRVLDPWVHQCWEGEAEAIKVSLRLGILYQI